MLQKKGMKREGQTAVRKIVLGTTASMMVMIAIVSLLAKLVLTDFVNEEGLGYCMVFVHLIAVTTGCCIATANWKENKLYSCLITGIVYSTVLLAMTALIFDGQYQGVAATMTVIISGSVIAAMMCKSGIKAGKVRRSRKRRG